MKRILLSTLLALGVTAGAHAAAATEAVDETLRVDELPPYERVDSIPALTRLYSFHPVDSDTLVIWATAFDPYLVELSFPSHDLRWAHSIGVDNRTGRIYERFDSVTVRGLRYPIREIYKLTREQARSL